MPATFDAKISRKSCALRKRNIMRNKSISWITRRRSSSDNISFFGPNGSRCNRLRGRRKVAVISICLTEFPKQQYKLGCNLGFFFLDVQTIPLWSTILLPRSTFSGLALTPLNSSVLIRLSLFTATWSYATQPTQIPSVRRSVLQVTEGNVKLAITRWMRRILWPKVHSFLLARRKKRRKAMVEPVTRWVVSAQTLK